MYSIEGNKLTVEGAIVINFNAPIEKYLIDSESNIVLLLEEESNSNVLKYNKGGSLLWRIEEGSYPRLCPVTNIFFQKERFYVYRRCGVEECIDLKDGTILTSELIK